MSNAERHPNLTPVADLIGTWAGNGRGEYPTIDSFEYVEHVEFSHVGKPFLSYQQRTKHPQTGAPMHAEFAYWRFPEPGSVEFVAIHPTGFTELSHGTLSTTDTGLVIDLHRSEIGRTDTAKEVTALHRRFDLAGDVLSYEITMAAVGLPEQFHLAATLRRVA